MMTGYSALYPVAARPGGSRHSTFRRPDILVKKQRIHQASKEGSALATSSGRIKISITPNDRDAIFREALLAVDKAPIFSWPKKKIGDLFMSKMRVLLKEEKRYDFHDELRVKLGKIAQVALDEGFKLAEDRRKLAMFVIGYFIEPKDLVWEGQSNLGYLDDFLITHIAFEILSRDIKRWERLRKPR
jgi:uncharacterized membrane protein YkvA (DUF1232 family)